MKKVFVVAALCLFIVTAAPAQNIGLYDVGGALGFASLSSGGESHTGLGLNARVNLGELIDNLFLVPDINFWTTSKDYHGGSWRLSDFAINGNVQYRFDLDGSIEPYAGGGLGLNFLRSKADWDDPHWGLGGSWTYSETKLGINLIGGAHFNLDGNITPFGEFRYVVVSNWDYLMIKAGIMYKL